MSAASSPRKRYPGSLTDLSRYRTTVHGHDGSSRVVMVRKTDQRTYASRESGQTDTKFETVTRETIETFRGPRTACKVTTETKDIEEKVPPDLSYVLRSNRFKINPNSVKKTPCRHNRTRVMEHFVEDCLKAHNDYRKKHGVSPLKLSKDLCQISQRYANQLIRLSTLKHSDNKDYGENLFCIQSSNSNFTIQGSEPVDSWYDEIQYFTFGQEPTSLKAGHFTQVVWKGSKELGVGFAKNGGRIVVVTNYFPPGNYVSRYVENVPPPITKTINNNVSQIDKFLGKLSLSPRTTTMAGPIDKEFIQEFLQRHNEYRKIHNAEPLKLDDKLCKFSNEWAQHLASKNIFETRPNCDFGENIYCVSFNDPSYKIHGGDVVDKWYQEEKVHPYGKEPENLKSGHFTQMVWKTTSKLGVGVANPKGKIIVVANYDPPGNFLGQFSDNVLSADPASKTELEKKDQKKKEDAEAKKKEKRAAASKDLKNFDAFAVEGLQAHNSYRAKHGCPELILSKDMCAYAQEWAEKLASKGKMEHRPNCQYGENIYFFYSSDTSEKPSPTEAVKSWYDEIKDFKFDSDKVIQGTLHFTQVVWKETEELGMGYAKSKKGEWFVVANYNPKGNWVGKFIDNVPKLK